MPTLPPVSSPQKPGPCVAASALAPCGSISHPVLGSFYPGNYRGSRAWLWVATARKPQLGDPAQAHTLSDQPLPVLQEQADQPICPVLRASAADLKSGLASSHNLTVYVLNSHTVSPLLQHCPAKLKPLISAQSRVTLAGAMLVKSPSLDGALDPRKTPPYSRDLPQTSNSLGDAPPHLTPARVGGTSHWPVVLLYHLGLPFLEPDSALAIWGHCTATPSQLSHTALAWTDNSSRSPGARDKVATALS
jgi:hypothetical protein